MDDTDRPTDTQPKRSPVRAVLTIVGIVLAALILIAVAIYASAFLILAPIMQ